MIGLPATLVLNIRPYLQKHENVHFFLLPKFEFIFIYLFIFWITFEFFSS